VIADGDPGFRDASTMPTASDHDAADRDRIG
jgi:hypothetical protein